MKRSRMQQMSLEVVVGFFLMMVLLALGFFTIILSQDNIFSTSHDKTVVFDQVSGLIKGDKVFVKGVDVGRVKSLVVKRDGVHATLTLSYPVELHEDYRVSVVPSSVLGGKFVDIQEGTADKPLLPDDAVVKGRGPTDFIAELTDGVKAVRESLEGGGVLGNLEETMDNLKELTRRLREGEGTIGKLLTEDAIYTNLLAVSDRLAKGEGTLGKLLSSDDTLYRDLSDTVAALKETAETINKGEGTLGKLIKDDGIYTQVDGLMGEIRAAVDDLRETTPVVSFSSIFFGAF
ncbi:MAG TPA: MlaD family protein [Kiritimatiellia bacterium]|nr:MlaD family protein [Kiritimatiellia bacterium]